MVVQKNIPKIIIYFIIQTKGDNGVGLLGSILWNEKTKRALEKK